MRGEEIRWKIRVLENNNLFTFCNKIYLDLSREIIR